MHRGAGAHRTRLFRHKQIAIVQSPVAERCCRLRYSQNLRVRSRVLQHFDLIIPAANDAPVLRDHRADRHFVAGRGFGGETQGLAHERLIVAKEQIHRRADTVGTRKSQRMRSTMKMVLGLIALAGSTVRLFLYKSSRISQSEPMRLSLLGLAFLALAAASYAQEQERKLVDRLLTPNTKLANPDQNKKFAGGSEAPTRSAATKSFYVSEKNLSKTFVADRSAPTTSFRT